jgi:protein-serine/threonine kinase
MLKGLLMRRQSSQASGDTEAPSPEMAAPSVPGAELVREPVYGDPSQDQGDEVRFYVELTKLDGLKDTYSIDIRRLKGNLRSYKFLYDCITEYVFLPPSQSLGVGCVAELDLLFLLRYSRLVLQR